MPKLAVFLDDGGVMNDNSIRVFEWQRLLGEFFVPRLGGAHEQWAAANRATAEMSFRKAMALQSSLSSIGGFDGWARYYLTEWMRDMADHAGIAIPAHDNDVVALAREASAFVTANCHSAFPEAATAIRTLADAGFSLHTASGEESVDLHGYLTGMCVRDRFGYLFGPDLIDAFKNGPTYYERAFAMAGLDPSRCAVIDDSLEALGWAAEAGAVGILVSRAGVKPVDYAGHVVSSLLELPPLLGKLQRQTT